MNIEHDAQWLENESDNNPVMSIFAVRYFEHMKAKEKQAEDRLQSLAIEQECKICNYSFQGLVPCKCRMRVSADVFQAVVDRHESSKT